MEERHKTSQDKCIVHQWQIFHMCFWGNRAVSVFNTNAREKTDTQSSLIGLGSLLEALCLRNRNVRHELLMEIHKLFFRFLSPVPDPIPGHGHPLRDYAFALTGHPTVCRILLDEWSSRLKDLSMTKHNTQRDKTSMPPAAFEPALPASKRLHFHDLDRSPTRIGLVSYTVANLNVNSNGAKQINALCNFTSQTKWNYIEDNGIPSLKGML
jgi:hypothetical protein